MSLPAAFAAIAGQVSAAVGAPYHDGYVVSQGVPGGLDDDGAFQPGSPPIERACRCQIDAASEYLQAVGGYADGEVRFIILAASLAGSLDTDATVVIPFGERAGTWLVSSLERDPAGIAWAGKGRRR